MPGSLRLTPPAEPLPGVIEQATHWAGETVAFYVSADGAPAPSSSTALSDLICDLMHLADSQGLDFVEVLGVAEVAYRADRAADPDGQCQV